MLLSDMFDYSFSVFKNGYESVHFEDDSALEVLKRRVAKGEIKNEHELAFLEKQAENALHVTPIFHEFYEINGNIEINEFDETEELFHYKLKDHPGAFIEFSEITKRDEYGRTNHSVMDSIFAFANKYGLLRRNNYGVFRPEPISQWSQDSSMMNLLYTLYRAIQSNDDKTLKRLLSKDNEKFHFQIYSSLIADSAEIPVYQEVPVHRDRHANTFAEAAWELICYYTNEYLVRALTVSLQPNERATGAIMDTSPTDLISGLWMQFALTVSRNLKYKQCLECSSFFEVKTKKRRFEKIYCSDKCRKRVAARKRRMKEKSI